MNLDEWEEKHPEKKKPIGSPPNSGTAKAKTEPKPKKKVKKKVAVSAKNTSSTALTVSNANHLLNIPATMTLTGFKLPDVITEEQWTECGNRLKTVESGFQWWWGDWWITGKKQGWWNYGDGKEIAERIGINYKTITGYASVARSIESSLRRENLTFNHHKVVAGLPDQEDQKDLLEKAVVEKASVRKLGNMVKIKIGKKKATDAKTTEAKESSLSEADKQRIETAVSEFRNNELFAKVKAYVAQLPTMLERLAIADAILGIDPLVRYISK